MLRMSQLLPGHLLWLRQWSITRLSWFWTPTVSSALPCLLLRHFWAVAAGCVVTPRVIVLCHGRSLEPRIMTCYRKPFNTTNYCMSCPNPVARFVDKIGSCRQSLMTLNDAASCAWTALFYCHDYCCRFRRAGVRHGIMTL